MSTNTEPKWYQDMLAGSTQSYAYDPAHTHTLAGPIGIVDTNAAANSITLNAGSTDMLKVTKDGFYVRGVKVEQDEHEAEKVYECFKEWLTWSTLNRT